jgi:hypothetical protein
VIDYSIIPFDYFDSGFGGEAPKPTGFENRTEHLPIYKATEILSTIPDGAAQTQLAARRILRRRHHPALQPCRHLWSAGLRISGCKADSRKFIR